MERQIQLRWRVNRNVDVSGVSAVARELYARLSARTEPGQSTIDTGLDTAASDEAFAELSSAGAADLISVLKEGIRWPGRHTVQFKHDRKTTERLQRALIAARRSFELAEKGAL